MRDSRFWLGATLALALAASGARAQSPEAAGADGDQATKAHEFSTEDRWLLDGRDREMLHAGMPVELIGIDEGDATFRTRTPILANSDQAIVRVDADENYARRLAMYETGERFHTPPPRAAGASATDYNRSRQGSGTAAATSATTTPDDPEGDDAGGALNLISLLLSAGLIVLIAIKRK